VKAAKSAHNVFYKEIDFTSKTQLQFFKLQVLHAFGVSKRISHKLFKVYVSKSVLEWHATTEIESRQTSGFLPRLHVVSMKAQSSIVPRTQQRLKN